MNKTHKCIFVTTYMKDVKKMHKMVTTCDAAIKNVLRFENEVEDSKALQSRLSYARAWYAVKDVGGIWRFGPSKFIGYVDLDADEYISDSQENDGRRTEMQLAQWCTLVEPGDALYDMLYARLIAFLAEYGKAPSTKARINVLGDLYETPEEESESGSNDVIVDLLVAVAKTLPKDRLKRLKARLPK